jgi:hypothetical protein
VMPMDAALQPADLQLPDMHTFHLTPQVRLPKSVAFSVKEGKVKHHIMLASWMASPEPAKRSVANRLAWCTVPSTLQYLPDHR